MNIFRLQRTSLARKRAQAELTRRVAEAERELQAIQAIYASAPVGLCVLDPDLRYTRVNERLAEINGLPAADHIGKSLEEVVPQLADRAVPLAKHIFASGKPDFDVEISGETQSQPGVQRTWIGHWLPLRNPSGDITGISIAVEEITARRQAETALRIRERQIGFALQSSLSVVFVWDIERDAITRIAGADPIPAPPGGPIQKLEDVARAVHPDDRQKFDAAIDSALNSDDGHYSCEHRYISPDGSIRWVSEVGGVEFGENGKALRLIGVVHDITDRKEQEERVKLLLQEVNHRSKNMLSLVRSIAQLTKARQTDDFVERFSQRIGALAAAQDLLVEGEWKAVPIVELVQSQLAHFADLIGNRVTTAGPVLSLKPAAAQAIGMALHELATNAAKYGALSDGAGSVAIKWQLANNGAGEAMLTMFWTEQGGPPANVPSGIGFGSTVIKEMIEASTGGEASVEFEVSGLKWNFRALAADVLEGA